MSESLYGKKIFDECSEDAHKSQAGRLLRELDIEYVVNPELSGGSIKIVGDRVMNKTEIARKMHLNLNKLIDRLILWWRLQSHYFTDGTTFVYFTPVEDDKYLILVGDGGY